MMDVENFSLEPGYMTSRAEDVVADVNWWLGVGVGRDGLLMERFVLDKGTGKWIMESEHMVNNITSEMAPDSKTDVILKWKNPAKSGSSMANIHTDGFLSRKDEISEKKSFTITWTVPKTGQQNARRFTATKTAI
jgi:hypothetical protein